MPDRPLRRQSAGARQHPGPVHAPTPLRASAPGASLRLVRPSHPHRPILPPGIPEGPAISAAVRCLSLRLPRDLAAAWRHRLPASWRAVWQEQGSTQASGEGDLVAELSEEIGLDATRTVVLARAVAAALDARLAGAMSATRHRLPEDVQTVVPRGAAGGRFARSSA